MNNLKRLLRGSESPSKFLPAAIVVKALIFCMLLMINQDSSAQSKKSLKILLITSGCCHDYNLQTKALNEAVGKLANAEWTVVNDGGTTTKAELPLYDNPNWAKGYDVVVHNECYADTKSADYFRKITKAHYAGVPAVVVHCAMHTYRVAAEDDWREFLGVTSRRHDHLGKYAVKITDAKNPILKGMPEDWTVQSDELYVIEKIWPNTKTLATTVSQQDGKAYPVIWTNQYGKARVFGTTYGHSNSTFQDPVYLTMLSRGILWAAGQLKK